MQQVTPPDDHTWLDATEQEPEYTGKFDCKVLDGDQAIYPAQWIPRGKDTGYGERGPGWKVLLPPSAEGGRKRVRFYPVCKLKQWLPQPPPRRVQRSGTG